MMVAERPIKRNELEVGIVLDQRTPKVTTASKIRGDVFTLCNPIVDVEDGPTGYVSFCHSTALELVLSASIQADVLICSQLLLDIYWSLNSLHS